MIPISKPIIRKEEQKAVSQVLNSGMLSQGEKIEEFERRFAKFIGTKYAIATSSGTAALNLALWAHGLKEGDEIITTPFSFIASANACFFTGARPVFVDIDPKSFNINPNLIESKITSKTKAILIVHLFGNPCEMDKILSIAKNRQLILIEDACQAHGAKFKGKMVGSFGTGCFSFYATKNMTTGEGGMVTTNKKSIAEKIRLFRNHGLNAPYHSKVLGYNFWMSAIQAAIGIEQLKKLPLFNKRRIENARYLTQKLSNTKGITSPHTDPSIKNVFHQYTIRVEKTFPATRDELLEALKKKGIDARVYYPFPIHRQKFYRDLGYKDKLPVVEQIVKEVISLPVHPLVKISQLDLIADVITSFS